MTEDTLIQIQKKLEALQTYIARIRVYAPVTADALRTKAEVSGVVERNLQLDYFSGIAGFRNILVHNYMDIDYDEVADKVNNRLGDFEVFAKSVAQYLQ